MTVAGFLLDLEIVKMIKYAVLLIFISLLTFGCDPPKCFAWSSAPTREDIIICNQVRIGADGDYYAERKFQDCLQSLGYSKVEVECSK
jgi:hypothetical protein